MSLSNPKNTRKSPIARYYEFSGQTGEFKIYDCGTQESSKTTNLTFILIDQLNTVKGFSVKHSTGFYSNEVLRTSTEELVVKFNGGKIIARGLYKDIKPQIEALGGKYYKSLYGIEFIDGEWQLVNLKLKGAAMSAWLNFDKSSRINKEGLVLTVTKNPTQKKTGAVLYFEPDFTVQKPNEADLQKAMELDSDLQDFLKGASEPPQIDGPTEEERTQLRAPKSTGTGIYNGKMEEMSAEDFLNEDEADGELFDDI